MTFWRRSLMARLVTSFLLLSLMTVGVVGYVAYRQATEALKLSVSDRLSAVANMKEGELNRWVQDEARGVELIAGLPEVRSQTERLATRDEADPAYQAAHAALATHLSALASKADLLELLILSDAGGKILVSTDPSHEGQYRVSDRYFTEGRLGTFVQNVYPSPVTLKPTMTVATPLLDEADRRLGVLAAHLNLQRMDQIIQERIGLGASNEAYLVDRFNVFVSGERFGRQEFPRGVHTAGIDAAVQGRSGSGLYTNYEGVPVIGVYRWLTDRDLALLVEMHQGEAFAPARRLALTIFLIGLLSAGVLAVGVYLVARQIAQPVLAITRTAIQVAAGDLSPTAPVLTDDEIGALARAFNTMTERLRSLYEGLEGKVVELKRTEDELVKYKEKLEDQVAARTAQLRQANEALSQRAAELGIINSVGQALASQLHVEEMIALVGQQLRKTFDAQIVYVALHDRQAGTIGFPHYVENGQQRFVAPLRFGEGLASEILQSRQPLLLNRQEQFDQLGSRVLGTPAKSYLGVPIMVGDEAIGVVGVQNTVREGMFGETEVRLLTTIAANVGVAIERARLYASARRQKEYFESLVQNSPVAIVTRGLDGNVVSWNPAAERLFGYPEAEAMGRDLDGLITTEEMRAEAIDYSKKTLSGDLVHAISRRSRKDGTVVDVELLSVPVFVSGEQVGTIAVYHDITELQRARQEAEAANQAKSAFLATMSHEIRTPMNAVIGMSGLLLNTDLTPEQREFTEIIRSSGDALLTIINDILDFSKIEAGKMELEHAPFDLRDCFEAALDLVAIKAAEKGLDLACQVDDGTPTAIVGDVTRLRQILLNLLNNSVKFTEQGEVVASVASRPLGDRRHELHFAVRDTGIGIPADRLDRLFQPFSQVDASTTRKYGGTGLGLAISQRLSELMGGTMWVESEVGKGTTFHFTVVADAADAVATRDFLRGEQPPLRGKRLLVVDDNATSRHIVAQHARAWGMLARDTGSPAEALEWIRRGDPFDVAILDVLMPEMDGWTLAREIRKHRDGRALPLVMLSSLGRHDAGSDGASFAAQLTKPLKPSQLFDALGSIFAEQTAPTRKPAAARPPVDPEMATRLPRRILLAEDNAVNQKLALRLLGQMGYQADVAGNGLEAIQALERQRYDVVLMDVQMPEMDGLEAARQICLRWPRAERPRIVAMTANAMPGDRELCLEAGMDDYVGKPIRVDELVRALSESPSLA